jgi:hypothetical protein
MDTGVVTGVTRWMPLVDLEHLILQGHPSSHPIFGRVRIAQSLVFCVVFRRLLLCQKWNRNNYSSWILSPVRSAYSINKR